jgi:ATP-dependent DNA helicase RecG
VVEVGVDIPQATVMVVEHPERFGLSQLHQLRGRVGRGGGEAHFLMAAPPKLSVEAHDRLRVLERESNGFRVAEEDLRIRGPGDLLGTAQHGLPKFRVGDLIENPQWLQNAREAAEEILRRDPELRLVEHRPLRAAILTRYAEGMDLFRVG